MNADGSPGIQVEGEFGLHVPRVVDIGAGLLAGGLLLCRSASRSSWSACAPDHPSCRLRPRRRTSPSGSKRPT